MRISALLATAFICGTSAQATQVDFGVAYPFWARAGVSDVAALGGTVGGGLSTRGADISYARGLSLPPLGAVSVSSQAQLAWGGGLRLSSRGSGTVGPVAVNLGGAYFTTAAATFDPLANWTLAATDTRSNGWNADLSVRYRINRQWVGIVGGEFGPQNNGFLGVESRRELTRTLPLAEGDDPDAPRETESSGALTYRAGLRAGHDVLGATAGITYATASGNSFALDAQFGPGRGGNSGLGLVGSANFPNLLGEDSNLKVYAAYEPWRENAAYLRAGVEASKPIGPGVATFNVRGGQVKAAAGTANSGGFGISLGYAFPLGSK